MERNTLLKLRRISSVKEIGKRLLARSLAVLTNRIFLGESLSPTRFPIIAVTRKEETTTGQMTLRMRPVKCLGLPLPPRKRRLSSPDSPGKGDKAVPVCEEKEPKEWTYKDMIGLPAGQLEEWRAACQREIEILTKRHVFDMVVRPSGCRVIKNRWVFDVKPEVEREPAL